MAAKKDKAKSIFTDNKKGSSELILELNSLLKNHLKKKELILNIVKEGKKELKPFASVQNYLSKVEKLLKKNPLSLSEFIINFERDYSDTANKIFKKGKPLFKDINTVLTISNSGIVFNFLKLLAQEKKHLKVIISESRPIMEGRILAKKLLKEGIKVELITEAMISGYIKNCDAVLAGADVILKNGNIVNKTGTRNLAIIAKHSGVPFYIVSEKLKISKGVSFDSGVHTPDEVWQHKDKNLSVPNYYFEEVRSDLITKIITD